MAYLLAAVVAFLILRLRRRRGGGEVRPRAVQPGGVAGERGAVQLHLPAQGRRGLPGQGVLHLRVLHPGRQELPQVRRRRQPRHPQARDRRLLRPNLPRDHSGWATAPDGPYAWGLCYKEEISPASNYCDATDTQWPCYPGKSYHGRGPIQLSWNFNYGPAGRALGFDGLRNPEVVANCSETAFRTALWFWIPPRRPKPSCHEVMVGEYRPTAADATANRTAGFGLVTNTVNGGLECNRTDDARVNNRIGFYRRYCQIFNVGAGANLDCEHQQPY
ncbi:hypothetical protein ACP70R_046080 [Stipagrostis hirtigluma subsp. patula]